MNSTENSEIKAIRVDFRQYENELALLANTWMQSQVFARENPQAMAIYSPHGNRTFLALHENANRLVSAMLAVGIKPGDAAAVMCRNRAEFLEIFLASMRMGIRLTPVNTHLTPSEVSYIVKNCEAKIFFTDSAALTSDIAVDQMPAQILIGTFAAVDTKPSTTYVDFIARCTATLPITPVMGTLMLYTSGTTGKPKGVWRGTPEPIVPQYAGSFADYDTTKDVALCCGPAYHAAPLLFDLRWPLASGIPIVLMDKWDAMETLELIERHQVTHTHMVATMFQRLLALPTNSRQQKNVSSLRLLVHGAAPCPILVKRAMIDWLGPILIEYYGATEGGNGIHVNSADWLKKPGTVGRMDASLGHAILDENMQEVPQGVAGRIFFKAPDVGRFSYFGDSEKTAEAYADNRFTMGDVGYLDEDRYLFLTGRIAECIISGGVNIYPQEIDDVLLSHDAVRDVCTVGIPDQEWGEQVVSLVVLEAHYSPDDTTAQQLLAYASSQLASFKRPRKILFERELPRSASGKLLRQQVRQRFWQNQQRAI